MAEEYVSIAGWLATTIGPAKTWEWGPIILRRVGGHGIAALCENSAGTTAMLLLVLSGSGAA